MSREVRRVPLDFDFPLDKTWTGYLTPKELRLPACGDCFGSGWTSAHDWVAAIVHLLLMVGEDVAAQERGKDLHPYLALLDNRPDHFADRDRKFVTPRPSADAVLLTSGLAGCEPDDFLFGYGSRGEWHAVAAIVKAAGLPDTWGICGTCSGTGDVATPEQQAAHEAWEPTEHPTGEGYQLWQTVSEGGPVSPVFAEPAGLADWIVASGKNLHGSNTPREALITWIASEGSSIGSFAHVPGKGIVSGVELAAIDRNLPEQLPIANAETASALSDQTGGRS